MIKLNLLPDVKLNFQRARRLRARITGVAIVTTAASVGAVVLIVSYVYGVQKLQLDALNKNIASNTAKFSAIPEVNKYLTLQRQLEKIDALHEGKNDFSRLLDFLPALNPAPPNSARITNIELQAGDESIGTSPILKLKGEVADYTALNTFVDTLRNAQLLYGGETDKLFDSVEVVTSALEDSQQGGKVVSFDITTSYNPQAFLFANKDVRINVPNIITTQSTQAAPSVFGESTVREGEEN